jgi:hypothetical protein
MIPKSANRFSVNIMRQRKKRGSWQRKKKPGAVARTGRA